MSSLMVAFRWTVLGVAVVVGLSACYDTLRPGRCNQTSDCAAMSGYGAGYVCNLDFNQQGDGRCVPRCQNSSECEGGRVCDVDGQGVGRCLFPETPDGGGDGDVGGDGDAGDGGDAPHCPVCQGSTPVCVGVTCVECATSADCKSDLTKPICDTTAHTCGACTSDDQCGAKLGSTPGVCMAHQDGRCATDAEAIYVDSANTSCIAILRAETDGTSAQPFCTLDLARRLLNGDGSLPPAARTLLIVRGGPMDAATGPFIRPAGGTEVSIIGQNSAVIVGGTKRGLDFQNGAFYVRDLKVSLSTSIGINAAAVAPAVVALRLDHVTVDSCQGGGILLDRATFDIVNTTVTNSGPGDDVGTPWGGIRIKNLPASGQARLDHVTIENNKQIGLTCTTQINGSAVLAADNSGGVEVSPTCNVSPCSAAGPTCGAP